MNHFLTCVMGAAAVSMALVRTLAAGEPVKVGEYALSGPYVHDNLTIFLLHGKDKMDAKNFLTLEEALDQKLVVVHETGNVNELAIENQSKDKHVYVPSGSIVKGGKQDRVMQNDLILPPNSGKQPIASFCVEQGRWRGRGNEAAVQFGASNQTLNSKDLKMAAKVSGNQGEVWAKVSESQEKLSSNVGESVKAPESGTSLQLTLENKKLQESVDGYVKDLGNLLEDKPDALGYAVAVNGKFTSADVYASSALFRKLWPQYLRASATEAVAELKKDQKFDPAKAEDVRAAMTEADQGKKTGEKTPAASTRIDTQDSARAARVRTVTPNDNVEVRKEYLGK